MTVPKPSELLDFSGETVLVTGSGQGLGAGIALRFAEAGANVVIHYRSSEQGAKEVAEQIRSMGREAITIQADVTQESDVEKMFNQAIEAFGKISVVVNNAGIYPLSNLIDMPLAEWDAVIDANLKSTHLCTQKAAQHMIQQSDALNAIINIASIEGLHPAPMHSHYNAAKGAVLMHTKAAAQELGAQGIRVNAVSPGLIWREGIEQNWADGVDRWQKAAPLQRLGMPDDVADACLFLASKAARWITGVNLVVDGGVTSNKIF